MSVGDHIDGGGEREGRNLLCREIEGVKASACAINGAEVELLRLGMPEGSFDAGVKVACQGGDLFGVEVIKVKLALVIIGDFIWGEFGGMTEDAKEGGTAFDE